jgi:hypothetical protein
MHADTLTDAEGDAAYAARYLGEEVLFAQRTGHDAPSVLVRARVGRNATVH